MGVRVIRLWMIGLLALGLLSGPAAALGPGDVFVIYNTAHPRSKEVADHYLRMRGVPPAQLIGLNLPITEEISRTDYEEKMVKPLRDALRPRWRDAKVLLCVYGVPLRVGPVKSTEAEEKEIAELKAKLDPAKKLQREKRAMVKGLEEGVATTQNKFLKEELEKERVELAKADKQVHDLEEAVRLRKHVESEAAVDSELMFLWWNNYPKARWLVNPLYWQVPERIRRGSPPVEMTCRLDGPTPEIAMRLVDDSVAVEKEGLNGQVYVDARGIAFDPKADPAGTGYGGYDESMREMARLLGDEAHMPVLLDNHPELFRPYSCDDCALYCGWYSVSKYVPCCKFNRGAVAWHLASFEAVSLRNPQTQWCGNLLRDGAAATLGAVAEPYAVAFPKPPEFFGFLVTGEYTLAECFAKTTALSSWMITLIGDPLYNPYKHSPRLKLKQVLPSPKGARPLLLAG